MIKQALFIAVLILGSISTQADTLVISGSFLSKTTLNGMAESDRDRAKIYLYSNGTWAGDDGKVSGKYTHKGNKYVLRWNPNYWPAIYAEASMTLDKHTPFTQYVELNKSRSKATVKSDFTVWVTDEDDEHYKIRYEDSCKCSVKKIKK
jgi:hypothetical protein